MKIKLLAVFLVMAAVGRLQAGTQTEASPAGFKIASPDHPATWEVGFNDKVAQSLKWSESDGKLVLDVTYSRITYTDTIPPSDFKTYRVTFPGVMLDVYNNLYVLNGQKQKIVIGTRTGSPFGMQVALKDGVRLSAHRHDGRLNAMLVVGNAR